MGRWGEGLTEMKICLYFLTDSGNRTNVNVTEKLANNRNEMQHNGNLNHFKHITEINIMQWKF